MTKVVSTTWKVLSSNAWHIQNFKQLWGEREEGRSSQVVYLLNGSQLLGEAALGQHRQEVYQAPHNITIIIRELEGSDT